MAATNLPPRVAFSAFSGTGKTTLIERLIPLFTARGLSLGVMKHDAHRFEIDKPGKDSWRFTQAGALVVSLGSQEMTAFVERRALSPLEILERMRGLDLVLIEGYGGFDCPTVGIERAATGRGLRRPPESCAAIVTDGAPYPGIPCFSFDEAEALADFILKLLNIKG